MSELSPDNAIAGPRTEAAAEAICRQRCAHHGKRSCFSQPVRSCAERPSCAVLANAAIEQLIGHGCIQDGVFEERR